MLALRASVVLGVLCGSVLSGCGSTDLSTKDQKQKSQHGLKAASSLVLKAWPDGTLEVEVTNTSGKSFIFDPVAGLGFDIFNESEDGERVPLTDFYSNAEVGPPSPFQTVSLLPGARYIQLVKCNRSSIVGGDRSRLLHVKGRIFAIVYPLLTMSRKYQSDSKNWNLLDHELRSNSIEVPLD